MGKNAKKRSGVESRKVEPAPATKIYRGDPDLVYGHPLVCNRRDPFPGADWAQSETPIFPPHTASQRWLASHGFHPTWWLAETLAASWKSRFYPLKATIDSVSAWRRLIEAAAKDRSSSARIPDETESRRTLLADMEHDFGLIVAFNPTLRAAAEGPKTRTQERDQYIYDQVMRGERYTSICLRLPAECITNGWPDDGENTPTRCHQIAASYAAANGLPAPDPRPSS